VEYRLRCSRFLLTRALKFKTMPSFSRPFIRALHTSSRSFFRSVEVVRRAAVAMNTEFLEESCEVRINAFRSRILMILKICPFVQMRWLNTLRRIAGMKKIVFWPASVGEEPCYVMGTFRRWESKSSIAFFFQSAYPKPTPVSLKDFRPESVSWWSFRHKSILAQERTT
jgi:hypothetical protein